MCAYCDEHKLPHYGKWPEENGHKIPRGELPINFVPDSDTTGTYFCPACYAGRECMPELERFRGPAGFVYDEQGNRIIVLSRIVGRPTFMDPAFVSYLSKAVYNFTGKEGDHWLIYFPNGMNLRILEAIKKYGLILKTYDGWATATIGEERCLTRVLHGFRFVIFEECRLADFQNPPNMHPRETSVLH